jgi:hypothetical protein
VVAIEKVGVIVVAQRKKEKERERERWSVFL